MHTCGSPAGLDSLRLCEPLGMRGGLTTQEVGEGCAHVLLPEEGVHGEPLAERLQKNII